LFSVVIHGVILSLGLILPLGAQNVFIFQQGAIQKKFMDIMPVILTASLCDTILITIAVTGVSIMILTYHWITTFLMAAGVLFLIYMGYTTWRSPSGKKEEESKKYSFKKQIIFAASVSLLNPHALLDTIGVIGTNSIEYHGFFKYIFTISCIFVSWSWFFLLAFLGRTLGKANNAEMFFQLLNKVSAIIMWGVAVYLLLHLLKQP
jgi:L-lysine exporter family protein LysE/ArgO